MLTILLYLVIDVSIQDILIVHHQFFMLGKRNCCDVSLVSFETLDHIPDTWNTCAKSRLPRISIQEVKETLSQVFGNASSFFLAQAYSFV
jgi:hypothetical protein